MMKKSSLLDTKYHSRTIKIIGDVRIVFLRKEGDVVSKKYWYLIG